MGLRKLDAHLQGHPDMTRTPGVEVSTGSLGPGPLDVASASRSGCGSTGSTRRTCSRCMSDGDCQEGQTWEARDGGRPLRRLEPDRDRRLQPPPDRRHDRGGHGHQGRAQEVRGVRVGRGRDRRPRHGRGRRGARVEPHAASGRRRSSARPEGLRRVADGGPVRLPRQAAHARAGRAGADRARGDARRAERGSSGSSR